MNSRFFLLLLLVCATCLPAHALASPPHECGGDAPTEWYLTAVAPMLPAWQQNPDQLPPSTRGMPIRQGRIELAAFSDMNLEQLICWADKGDKLAALAAAVRLHEQVRPRYSTGQPGLAIVEHYLRVAARDESPSRPCAERFCHGVPEAMYRLAYYRGVRDDEWRSLMQRARDGGFTRAINELDGTISVGRD